LSRKRDSLGTTDKTEWEAGVTDILFAAATLAFFLVALSYVYFCERVK